MKQTLRVKINFTNAMNLAKEKADKRLTEEEIVNNALALYFSNTKREKGYEKR